jgi:hypothetical protein
VLAPKRVADSGGSLSTNKDATVYTVINMHIHLLLKGKSNSIPELAPSAKSAFLLPGTLSKPPSLSLSLLERERDLEPERRSMALLACLERWIGLPSSSHSDRKATVS